MDNKNDDRLVQIIFFNFCFITFQMYVEIYKTNIGIANCFTIKQTFSDRNRIKYLMINN